ncbi:MAG: hypothetical protein JWL97_3833 [Gemmatimonadales bacterium]|jgi:hypothetical protein|nr:hypothetical protein [Gemmatimonadales bacterium]
MISCANPDCPSHSHSELTMSHHWVQVEELQFQRIGDGPGATTGVVQRLFAAATCSKRCAAVVLTAAADVEDATRPPSPFR